MKLRIIEVEAAEGEAARIIEAVLGGGILPASAPRPSLQVSEPAAPALAAPKQSAPEEGGPPKPRTKNKGGRQKGAIEPGSVPARILEALQKKPLSSLELAGALKLEATQIYPACSTLKQRKLVESRNDDAGDGTRRYFIK